MTDIFNKKKQLTRTLSIISLSICICIETLAAAVRETIDVFGQDFKHVCCYINVKKGYKTCCCSACNNRHHLLSYFFDPEVQR